MQKGFDYLFEKTDQLPSELAEIVLAFDFTGGFTKVVSKYKLHLDQAEILEDLTFRIMFGDMDGVTYTSRLASDLSLPAGTAKELSDDINTAIVEPVKKDLMKHVEEEAEYYKDVELDESEIAEINNDGNKTSPSPQPFHPKSIYNEPITENAPIVHHIAPIHETKLTLSDVLHGIENPHPSIGGNSPIRTASGSKSYADIMGGSTTTKPVYPQPVVEIKPTPPPTPVPAPKIDLIAMKSSSVVVSAPNKIETLPVKSVDILPTDPYKESV